MVASQLTARELQVMSLILSGNSYAKVASKLGISIETVRKHAHNSYSKIGVKGRSAAKKQLIFANAA